MGNFTHFDADGASRMVDVGGKNATPRQARARGRVEMRCETLELIREGEISKGNVLEVARLAGIMAAKRTAELIPLCHPLPLDAVSIRFEYARTDTEEGSSDGRTAALDIEATVRVTARTGVEMEALAAVSIAALTVYDMCKSVDRAMSIRAIELAEKSGGSSGHFVRDAGATAGN